MQRDAFFALRGRTNNATYDLSSAILSQCDAPNRRANRILLLKLLQLSGVQNGAY